MRLIDADALGNRLYHEVFEKDSEDQRWDSGCWMRYRLFEKVLKEQPTIAQPERKRGKWIYGEDNLGTGGDGWFCSECGHFEKWDYSADMKSAELNLPNYCPNCGADMRGEQK